MKYQPTDCRKFIVSFRAFPLVLLYKSFSQIHVPPTTLSLWHHAFSNSSYYFVLFLMRLVGSQCDQEIKKKSLNIVNRPALSMLKIRYIAGNMFEIFLFLQLLMEVLVMMSLIINSLAGKDQKGKQGRDVMEKIHHTSTSYHKFRHPIRVTFSETIFIYYHFHCFN